MKNDIFTNGLLQIRITKELFLLLSPRNMSAPVTSSNNLVYYIINFLLPPHQRKNPGYGPVFTLSSPLLSSPLLSSPSRATISS